MSLLEVPHLIPRKDLDPSIIGQKTIKSFLDILPLSSVVVPCERVARVPQILETAIGN